MKEIFGRKIGMTRLFVESGEAIPVTVIEAGPGQVVAKKTKEKDGYEAVQIGFFDKRKSLFNKAQLGQFEKAGLTPTRYLREIKYAGEIAVGGTVKADLFKKGERVDVTGISKGLGFQGVIRRHGFGGGKKTHGQSDRWRAPGSIGASSYPSRVYKGMRMAGKMGKDQVTILNLEIVRIIEDQNLILVRGAVPGKKGTLLKIRQSNRSR